MPRKYSAFTLVELLIVVGIISILVALVIAAINPEQLRREARDANRKKDLSIISTAMEQYYADNNAYPPESSSTEEDKILCLERILTGEDDDCDTSDAGSPVKYLNIMQITQLETPYEYCYNSPSPQQYVLCAPLEAGTEDEGGVADDVKCTPNYPDGSTYRYCVQNTF